MGAAKAAARPDDAQWPPWSAAIHKAWQDLVNERRIGFGAQGALLWSAVDRWAQRHDVDGEEFDFLWRMLRALDAEFLSHEQPPDKERDGQTGVAQGRGRP